MNFDEAFAKVINVEGGYVNDPNDAGGETKYGISKKQYPNLDIKNLTLDEAKAIYKKDFWNECQCENLPFWLAYHVFDAAVNSGNERAKIWLQRAVGAKPDGVIGAKTIACARRADPATAIARLSAFRLKFVVTAKTWRSHGKGWVNRIADNILETDYTKW